MGIVNNVTMLAIILAGSAVVREREHGTMDHLLVMPVTPFQIAMSKIWANGLVIAVSVALSLTFVVRWLLAIPIVGSVPLFMVGVVLYLFFSTSIGIFLATIAAHDAAARPATARRDAVELIVRQQYADRKPALAAAVDHGGVAIDAFRLLRSIDPFPGCWIRRRLARISSGRGGRRVIPPAGAVSLP